MTAQKASNGTFTPLPPPAVSEPQVHLADGPAHEIRFIPLAYSNQDSDASATRLILELFPEWRTEPGPIEFTRFKDGITNVLLKASKKRPNASEEQIEKESVLLRAYGNGTEVLIDRERETTSHAILAQHGLAPALLARFQNGLLYRFIRGQACSPADLRMEPVWRGVARRLAQWHAQLPIISDSNSKAMIQHETAIPVPHSPPINAIPGAADKLNELVPGRPSPNIWTVMQKWLWALPTTNKAHLSRRDRLQAELDRSAAELGLTPGLGGNGLIFGHCDLLSANVIIAPDQAAGKMDKIASVSFIDYEYATPAPAAFELANHFSEWGGFECEYSVLPTRTTRRAFIEEYVAFYQHQTQQLCQDNTGKNGASHHLAPAEYVDQLCNEVDQFRGIPGLYWGIWALIQAMISKIDFDYASYAETRLAEYFDFRAAQDSKKSSNGDSGGILLSDRERRWAES